MCEAWQSCSALILLPIVGAVILTQQEGSSGAIKLLQTIKCLQGVLVPVSVCPGCRQPCPIWAHPAPVLAFSSGCLLCWLQVTTAPLEGQPLPVVSLTCITPPAPTGCR